MDKNKSTFSKVTKIVVWVMVILLVISSLAGVMSLF